MVTYAPWTKSEQITITTEFPDPTSHPISFLFHLVIQTQETGYSDLYQCIHNLVGERRAKEWIDNVN